MTETTLTQNVNQQCFSERRCRACGGTLDSILDLGRLALPAFPAVDDPPPAVAPLDLCACARCRLVQLRHTTDPRLLFTDRYWYRSGVNETMRAELHDIATQAVAMAGNPSRQEFIVDVGANDGTLLSCYRQLPATKETVRIAFEPATSLHKELRPHAEVALADFFPQGLDQVTSLAGKVRILTSIAMFYDLDDPLAFVAAVDRILAPEGVWIVQFQDLAQMLEATAFDNIVAEHLVYYSLRSFERLLEGTNLIVTRADVREINGGSYRLYVQRPTVYPDPGVAELRQSEVVAGVEDWRTLDTFAWRVGQVRQQITAVVQQLRDQDKVIDLYAASTKANTLLQVCALGPEAIRQAWERSPEKWGRLTATGIPIVSEADGRAAPPDVLLVGAWGFRDAFIEREWAFLAAGGTMIVPLPTVDCVSAQRTVDVGGGA